MNIVCFEVDERIDGVTIGIGKGSDPSALSSYAFRLRSDGEPGIRSPVNVALNFAADLNLPIPFFEVFYQVGLTRDLELKHLMLRSG